MCHKPPDPTNNLPSTSPYLSHRTKPSEVALRMPNPKDFILTPCPKFTLPLLQPGIPWPTRSHSHRSHDVQDSPCLLAQFLRTKRWRTRSSSSAYQRTITRSLKVIWGTRAWVLMLSIWPSRGSIQHWLSVHSKTIRSVSNWYTPMDASLTYHKTKITKQFKRPYQSGQTRSQTSNSQRFISLLTTETSSLSRF